MGGKMIKISLKGFAKYMIASQSQQRKILRDFKNPDPEGYAQAMYYREARDFIENFHKAERDIEWLYEKANTLKVLAASASGQTKTRYQNNSRALNEYANQFGNKKYEILGKIRLRYDLEGVLISVYPDLHVMEKEREKIIKLEFSKSDLNPKIPKVIGLLMFEAAKRAGYNFKSSSVLFYDVARGNIFKGARVGSRMKKDIEAACKNIASIWPDL